VLECKDIESGCKVAIKVVRNVKKYCAEAKIEGEIIKAMNSLDPEQLWHCVKMFEMFEFLGHMCLVFEPLGPSLYDFMKSRHHQPFIPKHVQLFSRQLLEALCFLHHNSLVHTDLKPENVLLVHGGSEPLAEGHATEVPTNPSIKIIDFGGATFNHEDKATIISTRQYRAPEVLLEIDWSYSADIWSAACIIMELCTGTLLFQTHEDDEHFAMIEKSAAFR